jgi:hypothetical protein
MPLRFVHLINPYDPGSSGNGRRIQEITFAALKRAADEAKDNVSVTLATAQYASDRAIIPTGFTLTPDLTRSLDDVAGFPAGRRLPLMTDVLDSLRNFPDADYYIFSNMDIAPMPYFYNAVSAILEKNGSDALLINRRRISEKFLNEPIETMYAEAGLPHPGYDCFVFRRELLERFEFGNITPGVPGIGFLFAHNLFFATSSCTLLADKHLTFHVGLEIVRPWADARVTAFQRNEIMKFMQRHKSDFRIQNFPGYHLPFFKRHFRWLMNPLFHYPLMLQLDLPHLFDGREIVRPEKGDTAWQEWKARSTQIM